MRRSRIKAVANVPIRRKATPETSTPESTNPSSPIEKNDNNTTTNPVEDAECNLHLNQNRLRVAIDNSQSNADYCNASLAITNLPTTDVKPTKVINDIDDQSNSPTLETESIVDPIENDCQEYKAQQLLQITEEKALDSKEQCPGEIISIETNSSEKLGCDKAEARKKLLGKSTIASIISRRRFKPTVKLAPRCADKSNAQTPIPKTDTPSNPDKKTVIQENSQSICSGIQLSDNLPNAVISESTPLTLPPEKCSTSLNRKSDQLQTSTMHIKSSQSEKESAPSNSISLNNSQEVKESHDSLDRETSLANRYNFDFSKSVLPKIPRSPAHAQDIYNSEGSFNRTLVPPDSYSFELTQTSATNETSQRDSVIDTSPIKNVIGTKSLQDSIAIQNTNELQDLNAGKSPFTTMRSPENTFAGLRSPPYRSESFKSDSYSIKSPASPSKLLQNRSRFVRPVPRLDGGGRIRRNSIQGSGASASESEDDSRRSISNIPNRIRNDSICLVQSNKESTGNVGLRNLSKSNEGQKRRMVVSESARKLAEARREFYMKHGSKAPDRNKLTMYDLIYYNPVTNPMKKQCESAPVSRRNSICSTAESIVQEEENVDEPAAVPVPQVKVGPDGQLIIDEQSLIIEQTGTKKSREALANSEAVIDEGITGNGFYKRRQKSKEWPKWETLRFYKALNTIGTDFLLMQSLFPKRTRQEIKLKFKKEERTNRQLVEKALTYHQEFDVEALEKELADFEEREKRELEDKEKEKQFRVKEKERAKTGRRKLCHFVTSSIEEAGISEEEEVAQVPSPRTEEPVKLESNNNLCKQKTKKRNKRKHNISIEEALSDLMRGASSFVNSDSDDEIYQIKPTRSGRVPKIRKLQAPDVNTLDNTFNSETADTDSNLPPDNIKFEKQELRSDLEIISGDSESIVKMPEVINHAIPNMDHVEPGSLVILTSESVDEPGKTILQVYMVSPNTDPNGKQNMTPIDLSPELLATVTTRISQVEPAKIEAEQIVNTV